MGKDGSFEDWGALVRWATLRHTLVDQKESGFAVVWRFAIEGEAPRRQRVEVKRRHGHDEEWIELLARVELGASFSARMALDTSGELVAGTLVLDDGDYAIRSVLPRCVTRDAFEQALELIAFEAASLPLSIAEPPTLSLGFLAEMYA